MTEWYIKDKIGQFVGIAKSSEQLRRKEINQEIARLGGLLATDFDKILTEAKNKMISSIQYRLKEEIK